MEGEDDDERVDGLEEVEDEDDRSGLERFTGRSGTDACLTKPAKKVDPAVCLLPRESSGKKNPVENKH